MSLPAVLRFVQTTLDGTTSAYLPDAKAFVTPQVGQVIDTPIISIWTRGWDEKRATMTRVAGNPGASGFKKVTHSIEMYVKALGAQDAPNADVAFHTLLDAIEARMRAVVMPFPLVDPATNATSQITAIGEQFQGKIGTLATTKDQLTYVWQAQITTPVEEWVQS